MATKPFAEVLQYWRSKSRDESEAGSSRQKVPALLKQSSTSSSNPDSDYNSDTEQLLAAESDANDTHWGPIHLCDFSKLWAPIFQHQLTDLAQATGSWDKDTGVLRFVSLQAYVPDVPTKDRKTGKMVKETVPMYLTPSDEGELYCSKEQSQAGPYKVTDRNALDVNYVLYNSKGLFILSNLDFALFSPRFHESYALVIVPHSDTTNIVDIKFKQWKPGMPCLQCKPVNGGPYNISITVNNATFWLYLDIVGTRVVVRGFQDCLANQHLVKAEFNFQNALLQ